MAAWFVPFASGWCWRSAVVVMATVAVVVVLLAVLLPRLNDQVESNNSALGSLAVAAGRRLPARFGSGTERVASRDRSRTHSLSRARTRVIIDTLAHAHPQRSTRSTFSMPAHASKDVGLPRERRRQVVANWWGLDFSARAFVRAAGPPAARCGPTATCRSAARSSSPSPYRCAQAALARDERWSLVGEIDLESLSAHMPNLARAAAVLPIIVDRLGQVVAHPDAASRHTPGKPGYLPLVQAGLAGRFNTESFFARGQRIHRYGDAEWATPAG
jgi:hypothetical protein